MKTFRVFLPALLVSFYTTGFACGFYPYGEDIRFCFFRPANWQYHSYADFNYSSNLFEPAPSVYKENEIRPNESLWISYCRNKITAADVRDALGAMPVGEIRPDSPNAMVRYLYKTKNAEAVDYLKFAKGCEVLNAFYEDPWERGQKLDGPKRAQLIARAKQLSVKAKDPEIRLRYTFLAIRLAFYNGDFDTIRDLYAKVFMMRSDKTVLDYWSLYFMTFAEINKPLANFYSAQVFAHAPDKRFVLHSMAPTSAPVDEVLRFAKTDRERANVYLLKAVTKHDQALADLKLIYDANSRFDGLDFLLLREVNKLEDWIYTPYYTLFHPSVNHYQNWRERIDHSGENEILGRVENDRKYAAQLLDFINAADLSKVKDPIFWQSAKAQLLFMTRQYDACLRMIGNLQTAIGKNSPASNQLDMLKTLCIVASQPGCESAVPESIKPIILKNKQDNKFVFAVGREFEYRGNSTDAALFYSKLNGDMTYWENFEGSGNYAFWGSYAAKGDYYSDYFENYFDYINVYYTPAQMEKLLAALNVPLGEDDFTAWEYSILPKEKSRLYDLLGTKYVRTDNLEMALANFRKVEGKFWDQQYSPWERGTAEGTNVFDGHPFYSLKYTPDFIPVKDKYLLTKTSVIEHLIAYKKRAENPSEKNRDYYSFLVANCYYNMTQYGNSWMLRRYHWSSSGYDGILEDAAEYSECNLAAKYYAMAEKSARTDKFRALCVRMLSVCEDHKLRHRFSQRDNTTYSELEKWVANNPYGRQLKQQFPDDYEKLAGSCIYFEDYFRARR